MQNKALDIMFFTKAFELNYLVFINSNYCILKYRV